MMMPPYLLATKSLQTRSVEAVHDLKRARGSTHGLQTASLWICALWDGWVILLNGGAEQVCGVQVWLWAVAICELSCHRMHDSTWKLPLLLCKWTAVAVGFGPQRVWLLVQGATTALVAGS